MSVASSTIMNCALSERCSGCDRIDFDRPALEADRRRELKSLGLGETPTDFVWISAGGLRDRLEFTMTGSSLGLFEKSPPGVTAAARDHRRAIVDIDTCPQLSAALQSWLTEFRQDLPRLKSKPELRGSIRLRVSPAGLRGVWLDFSNEDVRDLLEDEAWLTRRLEKGVIVEVGQRRKRVVVGAEGPRRHRLVDPILEPWFETPLAAASAGAERLTPLFATIGTFTQPGFRAQAALVTTVFAKLARLKGDRSAQNLRIAEFGAGIGAFTLPLLSTGALVDVFEFDRLAIEALEKGVVAAGLDRKMLNIHAGDFIQSTRAFDSAAAGKAKDTPDYDVILVDPPRPGVGKFLEAIEERASRADWIYVSCFPESFVKDAKVLETRGLTLDSITVVEQFPYTHHFEIIASFRR